MIIKQHKYVWITFFLITFIALIVGLTTSATISMWGLTFSVLLLSPCFLISIFLRFKLQKKLELMARDKKPRKKLYFYSVLSGILWSSFSFIPLLIGLMVELIGQSDIFNPYMILAYFVSYLIGFHISNYIDIKKSEQKTKD